MPADTSHNTHDPDREQLVAYLDGELSAEQALAVEQRLRKDAQFQAELQALERAWNALDNLERPEAGDQFASTTIAMATTEAHNEVASRTEAMPVERRRRRYSLVATAAVAALLGFLAVRLVTTAENRRLARDLPVVWQINVLSQVQGEPYLRLLLDKQHDLVRDFTSERAQKQAHTWTSLTGQSLRERTAWVQGLDEDQKAELATAARQFGALDPLRQESLRETNNALQNPQDSAADALRLAALAYHSWLSTQTPIVRAELRQIASDQERVDRVAELRREQLTSATQNLSRENSAALLEAVREVAEQDESLRIPRLIAARIGRAEAELSTTDLSPNRRRYTEEIMRRGRRLESALENYPALRVSMVSQTAHPFGRSARWVRAMFGDDYHDARKQAHADWLLIEQQLTAALSQPVQQSLAKQSHACRATWFRHWVLRAAGDAMQPENLDRFFASDKITNLERNELLALPREKMQEQLRRYYMERELGGVDPRAFPEFNELPGRDGRERGRGDERRPPPRPPRE